MSRPRAQIIWIDDEIDHLKPHILFLKEKGYVVTPVTNGVDGVSSIKDNEYDLVLLDHFMPGIDGIETLRKLKDVNSNIPVVMITKSEEEWLMDEAISEQVEEYLIKPVNPTQIFSTIKRVLEKKKIIGEKTIGDYLKEFQTIEVDLQNANSVNKWWKIFNKLTNWQITFDENRTTELESILDEQFQTSNREFVRFIEREYENLIKGSEDVSFSPDIIPNFCIPKLKSNKKVSIFVLDCLRYDQLLAIVPEINEFYNIDLDYSLSIIPTATPFARNAIFSGLYPDALFKKYPEQGKIIENHEPHQNKYEEKFLLDLLKENGLSNKSVHYHKIWKADEGKKFYNRITDYYDNDLIAVVINFIDLLAHKRSESDIIKEMVPDESGYRQAVRNWFDNSWFFDSLRELAESEYEIIITSDHGSVRVQNSMLVAADKSASTGVRYKFGRNLNCNNKNAIVIKDPKRFRLPEIGPQPTYLIAKNDTYFVYPNQTHQFEELYKDSFQHGGISMEEMFIPVAILKGKK